MTMRDLNLRDFLAHCGDISRSNLLPGEKAYQAAQWMWRLMPNISEFILPEHLKASEEGFRHNEIHIAPDLSFSLYTVVWAPGHWSPAHDHATWGVTGVMFGALEKRTYFQTAGDASTDGKHIILPTGTQILDEGTVATFAPENGEIVEIGVPEDREPVATLHLYGKNDGGGRIFDLKDHSSRPMEKPVQFW